MLTCLVMGLFGVFPFIYWVLEIDMVSALVLALGLSIVAWLNITLRRKKAFTLYAGSLVVEVLSPGLGASRKVYPLAKMRGQPVRVRRRSPLGVYSVTVGEGRQGLRFELFDRGQAEQLAIELKSAIPGGQNSSLSATS